MTSRRIAALSVTLALLAACGEKEAAPPAGQPPAQQTAAPATGAPLSEGTVLIEESFDTGAGPFRTGAIGPGTVQAAEGQLQVVIPGENVFTDAALSESAQVLRVEAQIEMTANGSAGVVCQSGQAPNGYLFKIGPGPQAGIFRVTPEGPVQLATGESQSLKLSQGLGLPPEVDFRAECLGQGAGLPTRLILYDCSECNQIAVDVEDPNGLGDITHVALGGEFFPGTVATGSAGVHFDDVRVTKY